jgi:glycosyltransferase involved in cell wall biosynthesis
VTTPSRKLLLVINHLSVLGGAEAQLLHLAKGLAELGHEVTICSVEPCAVEEWPLEQHGIRLVSLDASAPRERAAAIPALVRLARKADVVHCTMWDTSLWGRIAAMLARRPVIVADHATDRSIQVSSKGASRASWISRHNRVLDPFTFATVACASSQRALLIGEGVNPEKIVHIPNGIPVDDFVRSADGGPTRRDLGVPDDALVAIQVGVFRPEKNQVGALESFARVRERVEEAHILFVGIGETQAAIERRAAELGDGWAHFLGVRTDVAALLSLADIALLPSLSDAMPMVVLEAMALGVPLVATDVGDVRSALADVAGICVAPGDPEAFAGACVRLLTNPELRAEMARAGATRAREFDSSVMCRRYAALFEAACTGQAPTAAVAVVG